MYRRLIISLTFLAYSLTLVHGLVPHHHHEEVSKDHGHHQGMHDHHDDHDQKIISHVFADAVHHPGAGLIIHTPDSEIIQKKAIAADILIAKLKGFLNPELKPPASLSVYRKKYRSSYKDTFFLLRAPPLA